MSEVISGISPPLRVIGEKESACKEEEISSDALVADLLNEIKSTDQRFSMDEIAKAVKKQKKHSKGKDKKHKKKKSKRKHRKDSRSRTVSKSRSRSRSRSCSSHRERRSRRRHKSRSHSPAFFKAAKRADDTAGSRSSSSENERKSRKRKRSTTPSPPLFKNIPKSFDLPSIAKTSPKFDNISSGSDDDLPLGADYRSARPPTPPSVPDTNGKLDLDSLPSSIPIASHPIRKEGFPISKDRKKSPELPPPPPPKAESEMLKKVLEEKGKPSLIPRNLKKISIGKLSLPSASATPPTESQSPKDLDSSVEKDEVEEKVSKGEKGMTAMETEEISDGSIAEEIAKGIKASLNGKKANNGKSSPKATRSSSAESSISRTTDEMIKSKAIRGRGARNMQMHSDRLKEQPKKKNLKRMRKNYRSRSRTPSRSRDNNRWYSPVRSRRRSRSWSRGRGRSMSRSMSRSPSRSRGGDRRRRSGSRGGRDKERRGLASTRRSRSRSRDRQRHPKIDKAKLLEIAKKKAKTLQQMGIMTASGDVMQNATGQSIDQLVEYCHRLSKREEKEQRREQGEDVSSDSDLENFAANIKHPYDVRPAAPIKINISNAMPIPIRSAQERLLDEKTLRICYPVSSGQVHKENTESEWQRVEKDSIPITCTDTVKKTKAITSMEIEEAKKMGIDLVPPPPLAPLLPPPPMPPMFDNLPPPPAPPSFPSSSLSFLPPPPLPPMIIPAAEDKIIIREPDSNTKAPKDVSKVLAARAAASRRLDSNPNDYDARIEIKVLDEQMAAWASQGNLPGKFTGSTGIRVLSADELQPHDPRYNSWVKKDQFKVTRPLTTGVGMKLMQKMGWRPGEGLGKDAIGNLEPLQLDVKNDRRGLSTDGESSRKKNKSRAIPVQQLPGVPIPLAATLPDLGARNPVSVLTEYCSKRRIPMPDFECVEEGPPNSRKFTMTCSVNGVTYSPSGPSLTKKAAKALSCQVALQSIGLINRDPSLPMIS